MEFIEDKLHYKFIPNSLISYSLFTIKDKIFENDIFKKYNAQLQISGEIIINKINDNEIIQKYKLVDETYEEYIQFISEYDNKKDKWIYNIINGITEQENILYKDDIFLIIPNYTWINKDIKYMHILSIPYITSLRCIRSLEENHVKLLNNIKNITLKKIKQHYDLDENKIKMFFHYAPSTYHLHIHFVHIEHPSCDSSSEYSHNLDDVIYNLSIQSNYYQKRILRKRVL